MVINVIPGKMIATMPPVPYWRMTENTEKKARFVMDGQPFQIVVTRKDPHSDMDANLTQDFTVLDHKSCFMPGQMAGHVRGMMALMVSRVHGETIRVPQ